MPTFAPIRDIPQTGVTEWEFTMLNAIKEDLELVMGSRAAGVRAVMTDNVAAMIQPADVRVIKAITAQGGYATISSIDVPLLTDYIKLMVDVQNAINDIGRLQNQLNTLINAVRT